MSGEHNLNIPQDNANIWLDQKSVNYATLALLSVAILQTVFGILALGQVLSFFSETTSKWVGVRGGGDDALVLLLSGPT